jgi:hypothetical protein
MTRGAHLAVTARVTRYLWLRAYAPVEYGTRGPMNIAGLGTTWHVAVGPDRQWDTVLFEKSLDLDGL